MRLSTTVLALAISVLGAQVGGAQQAKECGPDGDVCPPPPAGTEAHSPAKPGTEAPGTLVVFWGVGCPRCEEARPFVESLVRESPGLAVEWVEVRQSEEGRRRFVRAMEHLDVRGGAGIPAFVAGDHIVVGWTSGVTENRLRAMLAGRSEGAARALHLPLIGAVDPTEWSLPALTVVIGLVDGINPCAMWALVVLLSLLVHVRSRRRLVLVGGTFVLVSGLVYFAFMAAWIGLYGVLGLSRTVTVVLAVIVILMGLVNLKELFWLKKGPSLMIPDKVKPGLYRRMRAIARSASTPAALAGVAALALLVNLVELGCTLGLPAVYTRLLSLHTELSSAGRLGYLGLYNAAYVVPLGLVVMAYALTLHKLALGNRGARVLKGVSGAVLLVFGVLLLFTPHTVL